MKRAGENLVSQPVQLWEFDFVVMISSQEGNKYWIIITVDFNLIFLTCSFGWEEVLAGKYPAKMCNTVNVLK